MKKTIQLSSLMLLISSGVFAQANTSYWLNSTPITGNANTAFGNLALAVSSGSYNSATGFNCLRNNTTGHNNVADGYLSMYYNTTGYYNTAIGSIAMISNTTGYRNTAVGYLSLGNNTGGNHNIAVGYLSASNNTTGNYNLALGIEALKNTSTGGSNAGIGYLALSANTSGSLNTSLGMYSNVSTSGQFMSTALGGFSICNADYKVRIGASSVTVIEGQVPYSYPSDGRFKNNISETDVKGLDFIKKLRPVVYNFDTKKFQEFLTKNMPDSVRQEYLKADFTASTAIRQSGFIAQEVEVAAQQCGYNFNGVHKPNDDNDNYSIAYSQFVVPLVKGMQEQQKMIEAQQQEIDELKKMLKDLAAQTTGISATTTLNEVSVYPNPNKGVFTINTNNIEAGKIQVLNPKGAQIQEITIQNGHSNYQIDLTAYPKGIYLINILTGNGSSTKKIIVE